MAITAELFDGTTLEFPDGTDPSVIQATAKRVTLERQMAGGEIPRNELGEVAERDPQGSKAYQAIKGLVDPIRPYVEPVTDYVGEQASLIAGAGLKGVANLQTSIAQNQVAGLMELQEARKSQYGTFENMPPKEQENYIKAQKVIEEKLGDVAKLGLEKKDIEKKYGVRGSTKELDSLSESQEYKDASFIGKMGMIGSKIGEDPIGIITDLGVESIPQSYAIAASAIATRFGMLNPKIAAGVGGSSSGMMQFGSEYANLREQGLDHKEAWEKAGVKSGIVGLFDAASFYSAGKAAGAVVDNIKKGAVKETAKTVAKETGKQAALGAGGEGVGSAVIGQEVDPLELTKEAIGEIFGAPGDAISTYQTKVAEARAAGMPDPEPPQEVKNLMDSKGFTFKRPEQEFAEAPQIDITGVGQVPEALAEPAVVDADLDAAQDLEAMLAELEEERDLDRELKQVSVQEEEAPAVELTPAEEKAAPAEPVAIKAMPQEEFLSKVQSPEIAGELQAMAANAGWAQVGGRLIRENMEDDTSKVTGRTTWIPKEEWWRGRPKGMTEAKTNKAVQKAIAGEQLSIPEKRMVEYMVNVAEGNVVRGSEERARLEESDRQVAQFEAERRVEEARVIADRLTQMGQQGPAQAIISAIEEGKPVTPEAIKFLRSKVEELSQPAPMELTSQTLDEARAAQAALEAQQVEQQRVASEQQRAEQAARDRAEIERRSAGAAQDFQLGQTAEENLTGQKDIFAEAPKANAITINSAVDDTPITFDNVPEKLFELARKVKEADEKANVWNAGAIKRNATMAFRRYNNEATDFLKSQGLLTGDYKKDNTTWMRFTTALDKQVEEKEEAAVEPKQAYTPPKLRTDNPGGGWLENKRQQSIEDGRKKSGVPIRFGSVTGYFREGSDVRKPLIPVDVLAKLQGMNDEQNNVRQKDLEAIKKIMDETGRLPPAPDGEDYVPFINVYQDGTAYVNEGNHRIMAAKALGFKYLPVEISYFNGAEQIKDGDLSPELVTSYDMQARDDKITLDNYRGEKKPKDMGSEAYPFVEPKTKTAVEETNVPLGEFQNGIIMGMNGENSKSGLISDEALKILKDNQLVSEDANGKMSLLPKGKNLSNAMYQARNLNVEERKDLFAKYIPQIAVETKATPAPRVEEDPDADIPFNIERKQTSTPAFKKWFGDSKVVDEDGKPLVMYHGTEAKEDFDAFDTTKKSVMGTGSFFSSTPSSAFAGAEKGRIIPAYLSLKNPKSYNYDQFESFNKDKLIKEGYDGVVVKGVNGTISMAVAFEPTQIKSAIGNIGTFDENNPDLTFNFERMFSQPAAYMAEEERTPSLRVEMNRLVKQFNEGKIAPETMMNRVEFVLDSTKKERQVKPRERGQYIIKEKLNRAVRRGELSENAAALTEWFIGQNPALVDDLGIAIKAPPEGSSASGYYNPMSRIFTLMKHSGNEETAVHEMLHHMERMMPEKVQAGIRKSWFSSLTKAAKKAQKGDNKDLQKYYKSLIDYHVNGDKAALKEAKNILENGSVDYDHYQHMNASEFWAVNAADIVAGRYANSKSILGKLKQWLKELGQKAKALFRLQSSAPILRALDSLSKADGRFETTEMIGAATDYMNRKNYKGGQAPLSSWQDPQESKLDNFLYKIQDKLIDTKRVQQAIEAQVGEIEDNWNAYMKEELYHGRTAKRVQDFLKNELLPIIKELSKAKINIGDFDNFLHNRHAEERNIQIAKINPNMPDAGSGIATADARQYMADLDPAQRKLMEKLANKIDAMVKETQNILVKNGLEEQSTIDAWNGAYKHYVPLKREDVDFVHTGTGLGQGFATRGSTSARATGSLKDVAEIFANLALQRERAIIRAEKSKVGKALYGLAIKNPNPDFWLPVNPDAVKNKAQLTQELISMGLDPLDAKNLIQEPRQQYIDPRTGLVAWRVNPVLRTSDNVFPVRINGQDRFIFFNSSDERAMRMVSALKNLDAEQLDIVLSTIGNVTRWLASVNTQYNPVFGAWNFLRDVGSATLNLSTTKIAGKEKKVLAGVIPALRGIYSDLRSDGKGTGEWSKLFQDFQEAGGQTGYRDQFSRNRRQANVVEREMKIAERGITKRAFFGIAQWLSDYNDSMENAVRLSAYKVALDQGLSKDQAASLAKNLTVNFNRKGQWSQTVGALYAFFNASTQGTVRLMETMKGPKGRKIMAGGLALGTLQAIALAAAGFDDDEPPEFIKSRNLVIPTGGGGYVMIPMPLGFNVIPNTGRMMTEFVLSGGKKPGKKVVDFMAMVFDSFNPVGGSGLQLISPTVADPIVALYTNKDAFGRPISKEDRATAPTPGYSRSRENATTFNKYVAEFLNLASGGTKYQKGGISPTADQLDYLIGQFTGGVGREIMKGATTVQATVTGEELPTYKIPVAGKIYGNTESPANISSKFYENVIMLSQHENEIKGRAKNRENPAAYIRENPVSRLTDRANSLENEISALNKTKKEMIERGISKERIKKIDERKTMLMRKFNEKVKEYENR